MPKDFSSLGEQTVVTNDDVLLIRNDADNLDRKVKKSVLKSSFSPSVGHIRDYLEGAADDMEALTNACNEVEVLQFGGYDMTITADWDFPLTGVCKRWELQGNTWNVSNNAIVSFPSGLGSYDFSIIGDGATYNGGLKLATVTAKSAEQPTQVTVDDNSDFEVGDQISSSWSLFHLPNASSRTTTLGDFNRVQSKPNSTTIVFQYQVAATTAEDDFAVPAETNILPVNTRLMNCRFDKQGINYSGTGHFHVEGVNFTDMPNAFAIAITDTTETATASWVNCTLERIALDALKFQGDSLYIRNFNIGEVLDVSKQILVWSNLETKGKLLVESCNWSNGNQDAFIYCENGKLPDRTFLNCNFDGKNTNLFEPTQDKETNSLNFEARINSLDFVEAGKFTASNCTFTNFVRHIVGTNYVNSDNWLQDNVLFENCFMDVDGVYFQSSGAGTLDIKPITYNNCILKGSNFKLALGAKNVSYNDCVVMEHFPIDGDELFETSTVTTRDYVKGQKIIDTSTGKKYRVNTDSTSGELLSNSSFFDDLGNAYYVESGDAITRDYKRFDYIFRTDNTRKYRCVAGGANQYQARQADGELLSGSLFESIECIIDRGTFKDTKLVGEFDIDETDDVRLNNLILPNRVNDTRPNFGLIYGEYLDNTITIEDVDRTNSTRPDLDEWFFSGNAETDVPNLRIKVADTDALIEYGQDESSAREYHYKVKCRRFDPSVGTTAPYQMRGAFLYDLVENSVATATRNPGEMKYVKTSVTCDIDTSASSGASSVDVTNVFNSVVPNAGDWLGLNNVGSATVNFHEITSVSGTGPYTLTISPTLVSSIDATTNACIMQHDYLTYKQAPKFEVVQAVNNQTYATAGSWTGPIKFDTSVSVGTSGVIPYASFDGTDTVTLPRGKYVFYFSCRLRHDSSAAATSAFSASVRLESTATSWSTIRSSEFQDLTSDGSTVVGRLSVEPVLTGTFILEEEADMTVGVYLSDPAQIISVDSDHRGATLSFTKIG